MSKKRMLALVLAAVMSLSSATVALADGESTAPVTETTTSTDETGGKQPGDEGNDLTETEETETGEQAPDGETPETPAETTVPKTEVPAATNAVTLDEPAELAEENISSAAELKNALATSGSYIVTNDFTVDEDLTAIASDITINFGSRKVTFNSDATLTVNDGAGLVLTGTEGGITKNDADNMFTVNNGGALTINGGKYKNTALSTSSESGGDRIVINSGTLTVNGGTISCGHDQAIHTSAYVNGTETLSQPVKCTINNGMIQGGNWGVVIFGDGEGKNDHSVLNITGGTISAEGQGIATNASDGKYAGFTINMTGGTVSGDCGIYLPGEGVTNIYEDASVIGGTQGVRIASGVLNVYGGSITANAPQNHNEGFIPGASGGTNGAIAVGKASSGYVGDIEINIYEGSTISNSSGDAIVVSDVKMGTSEYENNTIDINIENTDLAGDISVVTEENENSDNTGKNITISMNDSTLNGDFTVKSKEAVGELAGESTIAGSVDVVAGNNNVKMEATVDAESVTGNVTIGWIDLQPATPITPDRDRDNDDNSDYFGNETWDEVKDQIAEAEEGDTIKVSATGLPYFPSSVARALKGLDITLEIRKNGVTYEVNGLEIGDIDKIWYEFDELETELLTADAESEASSEADEEAKPIPDTGR